MFDLLLMLVSAKSKPKKKSKKEKKKSHLEPASGSSVSCGGGTQLWACEGNKKACRKGITVIKKKIKKRVISTKYQEKL